MQRATVSRLLFVTTIAVVLLPSVLSIAEPMIDWIGASANSRELYRRIAWEQLKATFSTAIGPNLATYVLAVALVPVAWTVWSNFTRGQGLFDGLPDDARGDRQDDRPPVRLQPSQRREARRAERSEPPDLAPPGL